ncbi:MarR family winged helix-turn-helix transcriptional regulator [Thermoactinospora rubra]|uniref:MarR family winged helix-turn-helix transcriptional regulator n=1 Tax=Thermoactinospora rubra TaxID=1088767 RepID=UPI00197D5702|nr:MarR family winged helix-turn-helix transcriptional regulator [Thermoactinospora rubra]
MNGEEPDGRLDRRLADALERLTTAIRTLAVAGAQAHGLSVVQLNALLALASQPAERRRVGALAEEFAVTAPTMSDAVTALERKGLLARIPVPGDARRRELALTPEGERLAATLTGWDGPLVESIGRLPRPEREALLRSALDLIAGLRRAGVITVDRSCVSCRFFGRDVRDDPAAPHFCGLLEQPLPAAELRVDCPEHEPAQARG